MRQYELIYIIQADLDETTLESVIDRVETQLKNNNGEVIKTERWGKKKLAYPIRKMSEGLYVFSLVKLDPASGVELKRNLGYVEQILRFSLLKSE